MGTRQYLIPGRAYINEATTKDYLIPGQAYVNETQSSGGGSTYNDSFTETVTGADSEAVVLTANPTTSDSVAGSDTEGAAVTFVTSLSDSVTAADSEVGGLLTVDSFTESVTGADSQSAATTFAAILSESIGGADALGGTVTFADGVTESLTANDGSTVDGTSNIDTHDPSIKRHHIYALSDAQKKRLREKLRKAIKKRRQEDDAPQGFIEVLPIEEEIIDKIETVKAALPEVAKIDFIEHFNSSAEWEQLKKALNFALKYQEEQLKIRQEEEELFLLVCAIAA